MVINVSGSGSQLEPVASICWDCMLFFDVLYFQCHFQSMFAFWVGVGIYQVTH